MKTDIKPMKTLTGLTVTGLMMLALTGAPRLHAQEGASTAAVSTANPVVWSANQMYTRLAKNMVAAAEEMPADKFTYHPTPEQMTFGKLVSHVALANGHVCGMLSGATAPATLKVSETASKEDLVAAIKASFDFCGPVLANLQDAQLGDTITFFGGARVPRARALVELTGDLEDHYSQMAGYLRLNGLLPPSATPHK